MTITASLAKNLTNTVRLFTEHSYNSLRDAQRNLQGRTHYVDADTLKCFRSRVLSTGIEADGLIYWMIESVSLDSEHKSRGFRHVAFDVFGTVLDRVSLDDASKTKQAACKALAKWLESFDVMAHYAKAIESRARNLRREASELVAALSEAS